VRDSIIVTCASLTQDSASLAEDQAGIDRPALMVLNRHSPDQPKAASAESMLRCRAVSDHAMTVKP